MLVTWVTRLASRSPNNKLVRHQRSTNILLSALERIPLPPRSNPSPPRTMERGGLTRMTYVRIYVKMNKAARNVTGLFPRPRTKICSKERIPLPRIPLSWSHRAGSIGKKSRFFPSSFPFTTNGTRCCIGVGCVLHQWALRKNYLIGRGLWKYRPANERENSRFRILFRRVYFYIASGMINPF